MGLVGGNSFITVHETISVSTGGEPFSCHTYPEPLRGIKLCGCYVIICFGLNEGLTMIINDHY